MMVNKIHVSAEGNNPHRSVKRQVGKYNAGLYCVDCSEFFALAIAEREITAEFISDGDPLFQCPFCNLIQRRQISEVGAFLLTEERLRRPPPPPGAH